MTDGVLLGGADVPVHALGDVFGDGERQLMLVHEKFDDGFLCDRLKRPDLKPRLQLFGQVFDGLVGGAEEDNVVGQIVQIGAEIVEGIGLDALSFIHELNGQFAHADHRAVAGLDTAQEFVDELNELLARYNATDAAAITSAIKPVAEFHTVRHSILTVEENMRLEEVIPITAMVKTKGRGGK